MDVRKGGVFCFISDGVIVIRCVWEGLTNKLCVHM